VYSFFNADQIFDFLLSIDMRPFVELSFMPTALASKDDVVFRYRGNITPPKEYEAWEAPALSRCSPRRFISSISHGVRSI
jgi:beta-xylosidase